MQQPSEYERAMVPLESETGQALVAHMGDDDVVRLSRLLDAFEPQQYGSWCGLAVLSTVLKVLGAARLPTQAALFESALIMQQRTKARQLNGGLSLADLYELTKQSLAQHGIQASVRREAAADPVLLTSAFDADCGDIHPHSATTTPPLLMINLIRTVGGATTGHWVLAAGSVHVGGECWVLILDPAAHKLGPHFLPDLHLISCMSTLNVRGEPRGYLAVVIQTHRPSCDTAMERDDARKRDGRERLDEGGGAEGEIEFGMV